MKEQQNQEKSFADIGKARQMLEAERQSRLQACQREILAVLEKHRCNLLAVPQITQEGRVVAVMQVVPGQEDGNVPQL